MWPLYTIVEKSSTLLLVLTFHINLQFTCQAFAVPPPSPFIEDVIFTRIANKTYEKAWKQLKLHCSCVIVLVYKLYLFIQLELQLPLYWQGKHENETLLPLTGVYIWNDEIVKLNNLELLAVSSTVRRKFKSRLCLIFYFIN